MKAQKNEIKQESVLATSNEQLKNEKYFRNNYPVSAFTVEHQTWKQTRYEIEALIVKS